ncbi:uncharacterized protein N7484_007453 [Penicillium longicatenatum]|uniref:uncharacterized protein n=1 Tax=Penicillium longicatenatum TaxID=1561947 RepID=UPI002549990D|nr:uncharacterized protein N7484_007453 [Penicillium longicatenatum]KAJ5639591.1 hypothetical protein N7484_007453 [Penicillium longicatenatum]
MPAYDQYSGANVCTQFVVVCGNNSLYLYGELSNRTKYRLSLQTTNLKSNMGRSAISKLGQYIKFGSAQMILETKSS